ncbi:phosphatidylinositol-specific phospholipase C X domain containing protein, putative [Entamoeba invadens IP1]|uniref:Phosphatidylinositol-specific phospholipase C X domain containing protein, putative n=1 Tax=Entamoeba invadens IP1 TaxID=370355 RepID=A0A0A1U648_ENTIV|nr:phosphatidylinositol-specific phospholipase C X domain containing protein, putative [Entamoeba invadens IP1]ELP89805.1 phosphatidylinositol-specific phospholipase C X domain containing protein, putative [Entamoeba invadens IP1]|eukprot:XP_004256576.1 phosphatidylinositol-specific phospholipase C X domain containing protein, putative [Entamoeba invadens IP1]
MEFPFANWMKTCAPIHERCIADISLVGSHDCATAKILKKHIIPPFSIVPTKYRGFIKRWAKTQRLSIGDQCKAGSRYFDFRVIYDTGLDDFFLLHGFYCIRLEDALKEIVQFLDEHADEVLIVDMNHIFNVKSKTVMKKLYNLIEGLCAKHAVLDDSDKIHAPLKSLVRLHQRMFVFCLNLPHVNLPKPLFVFDHAQVTSLWPNRNTTSRMMKVLSNNTRKAKDLTQPTIVQAIVTPSISSIRKSFYDKEYPATTLMIAQETNPVVLNWLHSQHTFINILLIDDIGKNDQIVAEMIKRNTTFPR